MEQPLAAAFKKSGYHVSTPSVETKLTELSSGLDKSVHWLAQQYEVFLSAREYSREVTLELADAFEEYARQASRKERKTSVSFADQNVAPGTSLKANLPSAKKLRTPGPQIPNPLKPAIKTPKPQPTETSTPSAPASNFTSRADKGKVVFCLNSELQVNTPAEEIAIRAIGEAMSPSQTFMVDRLQDKVNYLEDRIMDFAKAVEARDGISLEHPVNAASQEDVWIVGRICGEEDGRLSESSVMLEGSVAYSQGCRIHLDLTRLESYSVFPGQVIAARGSHVIDGKFTVKQIIDSAPLPLPDLAEGRGALSIVIAAGPFSPSSSVKCEALDELIEYCRTAKPGVLLLLGPYVDSESALIQSGQVDQLHQDIFEEWAVNKLITLGEHTTVVLLPSIRDAHHLPVFPQPAMQIAGTENMVFLDNPSTFSCQGSTFAVVSSDVLMPLSSQELRKGPTQDRMASLAAKVIQQRSFMPLFPPPLGACLDTSLAKHLTLPAMPDLIILPSDLNSFAKILPTSAASPSSSGSSHQCICVNPGRLTKGQSGGTFAHVKIAASPKATPIAQTCKIEIRKI